MRKINTSQYCCPITKDGYALKPIVGSEQNMLYCETSNTYVPIVNGIIYFNERSIYISEKKCLKKLEDLQNKSGSNTFEYSEFVKQKGRRGYNDAYAAFQPFNEASKAFYPFINGLKAMLQPGDVVIDIWNRTGWSTSFLASIFPEQQIISIWDKNKDVLGYKGYNFWFAQENMPKNVSVIFADLNGPLPFKTDSVSLVYAMDTMHWFPQETYIPELLRISKSNGAILFPHVHMANNDPNPFFERGGLQLHGEVYQNIFDNMLPAYNKKGYVFSEPDLFKLSAKKEMVSTPSTSDYNGCLAIFPEDHSIPLEPFVLPKNEIPKSRIIVNPFLRINYTQSRIELDRDHFEGSVGHIIDRHPVYDEMLSQNDGTILNEQIVRMLYFASMGNTIEAIAQKTNIQIEKIIEYAKTLQAKDIIEILPIDETGFRLQHFHSSQDYLTAETQQTLSHLWGNAINRFRDNNLLFSEFDESELTYEEVSEIVNLISERFSKNGFKKGDKIAIYAPVCAEANMLFWACMQNGLVYIPISHLMPLEQLSQILEQYEVALLFTDKALAIQHNCSAILLDSFEAESNQDFFSDWLDAENLENTFTKPVIQPTDDAVILFTSGSTGLAKGVVHTHNSLFRSGRLITENFHWMAKDKYLASADLDSMSGLRNCVIAPLHVGASITIPSTEQRMHAVAISELIHSAQISIVSTTPTLLRQWLLMGRRIRASLSTVKYIMCTGSNLSEELITDFEAMFKVPIINYYGLTETCGICIAVGRNDENYSNQTIGKAKGAIAQIVDNEGNVLPAGEEGNLRVLTNNVFKAYYNNESAYQNMVQDNWLYSGDTAIIDEAGWAFLKGRKRDIIKNTRGDLIYPLEIETFIKTNDSVKDAHVCAHVENDIEHIIAFVSLQSLEDQAVAIQEISKAIESKLGKGKLPKTFKIIDELPYNTNGKVNRSKLIAENI